MTFHETFYFQILVKLTDATTFPPAYLMKHQTSVTIVYVSIPTLQTLLVSEKG